MQRWLAALALSLLTLLVYSNSFGAAFVGDSEVLVLEDPRLRAATSANINSIFQRSYWWPYADSNLYRPLTTLSYLVNYSILGNQDRPAGYHVVNLLLHMLNVLLLFGISTKLVDSILERRLVRRSSSSEGGSLGGGAWISFFIAAIWAAHPLATEAVTQIVGRADLLAAAGTLGALYAHMQASESSGRQRTLWRIVTVAAATVAMFSKESGVAIVGVIVAYDLLLRYAHGFDIEGDQSREGGRGGRGRQRASARPAVALAKGGLPSLRAFLSTWLLLLMPLALLLYQRTVVTPPGLPPEPIIDNPIAGAGFLSGRLTALAVMGRYIWLMVWPATLSSDYSYAQIPIATGTPLDWAAWLTTLGSVGLFVFALWRGYRLVAFAGAFALMTFLPTSNLLFPTGTIMAERLMYLPLAGVVIAVVVPLALLMGRLKPAPTNSGTWGPATRTWGPALAGPLVLVGALAYRSWDRNKDWRDDVSIWTSAVEAAPNSFKAHKGLADAIYEADHDKRQLPRVIEELDKSIAILDTVPDESSAFAAYRRGAGTNLEYGDQLAEKSSQSDAERAYRRAAVLAERYLTVVRAVPLVRSTANPAATKDAELADGYSLLSSASIRLKDGEQALDAARRLQELRPRDAATYRLLSAALIALDRRDEAVVALLTGITLTGDAELRQASIDLYRAHPESACAFKPGRDGPVLNQECELVRRHLCVSAKEAAAIERRGGRLDHAEQLEAMSRVGYKCS
jgi:tetratricopeptide (TPR) repeat protein